MNYVPILLLIHIPHLVLSLQSWPSKWEGAESEKRSIPVFLTSTLWTEKIWFVQVTLWENKGISYCCQTFQWLRIEELLCGSPQHHPAMSVSRELFSQMLWPFHHRNSDWADLTLLHVGEKCGYPRDETAIEWNILDINLLNCSPSSKRLSELIPLCLTKPPWPPFILHTALFIFESDISHFFPLLPRPLLYPLKMPTYEGTILISLVSYQYVSSASCHNWKLGCLQTMRWG